MTERDYIDKSAVDEAQQGNQNDSFFTGAAQRLLSEQLAEHIEEWWGLVGGWEDLMGFRCWQVYGAWRAVLPRD